MGASSTQRGKPAVSVMYAECLHVLDDSDTSACHRRHQFYLVTVLPGNPYDCSAVRTLLIVIYLSGVIMLSGERQSGGGKNGGGPKASWGAVVVFWTLVGDARNSPSYLFSHASPVHFMRPTKSVARPTVYVTGIIRISYGAGRRGGRLEDFHCWGGIESGWSGEQSEQTMYMDGEVVKSCCRRPTQKVQVLRWPRLIFHHPSKLKMQAVITY